MLITWYVRGSKLGLQLLAVREDEEKARGLGVRVTGAKLIAFALSVGLTAMIGAVWGYYLLYIYPESAVDPLVMIGAVLMTFLGGKGTLWGPMIGAFVLVPAQQWTLTTYGATRLYLIAYATVFVIVLENKNFDETFGTASKAPYLAKDLVGQGEMLSQYYGIGHLSLDNYIALVSGQSPTPSRYHPLGWRCSCRARVTRAWNVLLPSRRHMRSGRLVSTWKV